MSERLDKFVEFVKGIFTDNGSPSCSRVTSFILSMGCLVILGLLLRHVANLPKEQMAIWVPNLPYIIIGLAGFSQAPYGLNRVGEWFQKKDTPKDAPS